MVSACPKEADPRPKVAQFVSDPSETVIGGLVTEGLMTLMDIVQAELEKQNPDGGILVMSKESMIDNGVMTVGDLKKYVASVDWSKIRIIVMRDDISVPRWPEAFVPLKGSGITLYMGGTGCKAVPMCTKTLNAFDKL